MRQKASKSDRRGNKYPTPPGVSPIFRPEKVGRWPSAKLKDFMATRGHSKTDLLRGLQVQPDTKVFCRSIYEHLEIQADHQRVAIGWISGSRSRRFGCVANIPLQPTRPGQKIHKLPARVPHETKNVSTAQAIGLLAGKSLDAPFQVLTPPRSEPVPPSCIPDKAQRREHTGVPRLPV